MSESGVDMNDKRGLKSLKGFQLMILFGCFVVGLILTGAIAFGFQAIPGLGERWALMLSAVAQCLIAFCLPAWLTAKLTTRFPLQWLGFTTCPSVKSIIGVLIVYVLALPALNQLISWNESIHFPESMQGLEESLRASEEAAREVSGKILASMNIWTMLAAVAVVGVLTGISEEMFFRGGLQKILTMQGHHTFAIWTAAIVFSAVHFQFFGFFPRVLMGAFFGYLLVWTGNLWVPIFAHAFNNSIVVVAFYLFGGTAIPDIDSVGVSQNGEFPWGAVTSGVATFLFLWKFRSYFFKHESSQPKYYG